MWINIVSHTDTPSRLAARVSLSFISVDVLLVFWFLCVVNDDIDFIELTLREIPKVAANNCAGKFILLNLVYYLNGFQYISQSTRLCMVGTTYGCESDDDVPMR